MGVRLVRLVIEEVSTIVMALAAVIVVLTTTRRAGSKIQGQNILKKIPLVIILARLLSM